MQDLAYTFPLRLDDLSPLAALAIFAGLGSVIVLMGLRSLVGLGPVRKWTAIVLRLLVLILLILILGNVKWQQPNKDVEVWVVRDISQSTGLAQGVPGGNVQSAMDKWLQSASSPGQSSSPSKKPGDRIGQVVFNESPHLDVVPEKVISDDTHALHDAGNGTNAAAGVQMALATMDPAAMHRIVLVWDGNPTEGNIEEAATAAAAQHVPIDILPLHYNVNNEVMVDHLVSPSWRDEKQAFSIQVFLTSTNSAPVTAKLTVEHQTEQGWVAMPLDGGSTQRSITLQPGPNVQRVTVPPQAGGVHQFRARLTDVGNVTIAGQTVSGDTLPGNNDGQTFTFVSGKGAVLFVDSYENNEGDLLVNALSGQGVNVRRVTPDQFPNDIVQLQNYDAVILGNVARGADGLQDSAVANLVKYVHDQGGGLVMVGGDHTFGAGGWEGSALEKELPVDMEIPAQRQMPKGALVLIMHACERETLNYWGEQCALRAAETLSARDEVGVICFSWNNGGAGGSIWQYPLGEKGDGTGVTNAIKTMSMGDMMSFDDCMEVALNGRNGVAGLLKSNAKEKHIIIISDGDPRPPNEKLMKDAIDNKITCSVVCVYPHGQNGVPDTMDQIAKRLHGKTYGPINDDFSKLPQIFIKEATIVRRSIVHEALNPPYLPVRLQPSNTDLVSGIAQEDLPPLRGVDLVVPKHNPLVELPLVLSDTARDPVLAHWHSGLGKTAVYTSDLGMKWADMWATAPMYGKFWRQVLNGVARPQSSRAYDVHMSIEGEKGHIVIEAVDKDNSFSNFVDFEGNVAGGPSLKSTPIHPVQTAPGVYEADFPAKEAGNYISYLNYAGPPGPNGEEPQSGRLLSGTVLNTSPELRQLQSDDSLLKRIAEITGGRVLDSWDSAAADVFNRQGLAPTASHQSIIEYLIPALLALLLLDIAARRIAWDRASIQKLGHVVKGHVQNFTVSTINRPDKKQPTVSTLRPETRAPKAGARSGPVASAKFVADRTVEGDISKVVGGATDKPIPSAPKTGAKPGAPESTMGGLMEAKRRAQQKIREKENEE